MKKMRRATKKMVTECKICGVPVDNPCGENETFQGKMQISGKNQEVQERKNNAESRQKGEWETETDHMVPKMNDSPRNRPDQEENKF